MSSPIVILSIDDKQAILELHRLILSSAGYRVLTATNGESALQIPTLNHVDLIITDQLLPDLTGVEIASQMKRLKPHVSIILYTGLQEYPFGAEDVDLILIKGISPPEFLAAIAKLIGKS